MRRIGTFEYGDDELRLAGLGPSSPRPAACEPLLIGAIAAVVVSDLSVRRKPALVDPRKEKEGRVLRFAAPISISPRPVPRR
jgi:hypothetical protein